jgi:hypothetical protein
MLVTLMTHLEFGNEPKDPGEGDRGHASPDESDLATHVDRFLLQVRRDERDDHACVYEENAEIEVGDQRWKARKSSMRDRDSPIQ